MTKEDLKSWRDSLNLTQREAADLLECSSRFIYMRWESGETELPTTLADRLAKAAATLASAPPDAPNAKQSPRLPRGAKRRYLTLAGHPLRFEDLPKQLNACYYEYGWQDKDRLHHHCFHMQVGRDWDGTIRGLSTPLNLDATTWTVTAELYLDNPAVVDAVKQMQAILDANAAHRTPFADLLNPPQQAPQAQSTGMFSTS